MDGRCQVLLGLKLHLIMELAEKKINSNLLFSFCCLRAYNLRCISFFYIQLRYTK
jgi:hypothetical protein